MTWKDSDFISKAWCIARSSYQSVEHIQKRAEKELRAAYEAGKKAERRSIEAQKKWGAP